MKTLIILLLLIVNCLSSQTIQDYLKEAENNNPLLKAKYIEYEQQLLNAPQISALPDPTISFGYFVTRPYTRVGPQNFKLSLVQKLPWFGTLTDYEQESLELAEAKRKDFEQKKDEVFFAVRANLYELYRIEEEKEYLKQSSELLNYIYPIVKTKVETSSARLSDLLTLELMISELETKINILEIEANPYREELKQLLNRNEDSKIAIPSVLEEIISISEMRVNIMNNPSVERLEILQKASKYRVSSASSESNPSITLGLDYINVSEMSDMSLQNNGLDIIMPMVGISIPFFSGKYSAKEEQATAMINQYEYERENLLNKLKSKFESILFNIKSDEERVILYDNQIKTLNNIRDLLYEEYSAIANEDILEVIRTEEKIIQYKKMKLDAEVSILNQKAQLISIVGE